MYNVQRQRSYIVISYTILIYITIFIGIVTIQIEPGPSIGPNIEPGPRKGPYLAFRKFEIFRKSRILETAG